MKTYSTMKIGLPAALLAILTCGSGWAQNQLPPGTEAPDSATQLAPVTNPEREAAESKIEQRDFQAARPLLEKFLANHPSDARALFDLGYVEDAAGEEDKAAADYRKAIAADPKQFESRLALGLLLAHQSKFELAKEQIQQATQLAPPNPGAQAQALRALAELDRSSDPPAARDALVAALRISPETPADLLLTAQIAEANGDLEPAQTAYQRLLTSTPGASPEMKSAATSGLAQLLIRQKNYADAEPLLKSAVARDPRDPALNAQLATALLAQKKTAEALPVLETLQKLQPGDNAVDQMLADAYSQAGQPIKADPIYARMAAAHPDNEEILVSQGGNLVRERRYFEAQQVLEKAVKLKPEDGDAWSGLAFAASENKQYPVALHALSMRAKLLGETPVSYFLWATTYDNLHQSKQAQDYYRKFLAVADGKFPDQEWQAKHRLVALGGSH
jgi:tetratricopeptide (TPR) repeat protein